MTTFDERENAFEKKFALDGDLQFRSEARRNKMLAEWAGGLFKLDAAELADYVKQVRKADLAEKGDEDLFRKLRGDFDTRRVTMSDAEIRQQMHALLAKAVTDIEAGR